MQDSKIIEQQIKKPDVDAKIEPDYIREHITSTQSIITTQSGVNLPIKHSNLQLLIIETKQEMVILANPKSV